MTTEEMIETFIQEGMKAFKKHYRKTPEGHKLETHNPVMLQGVWFNCWREYTVYKMAEHLRDILPEAEIEVEFDGNNSTLKVELTEEEQRKLNTSLYSFLDKWCL